MYTFKLINRRAFEPFKYWTIRIINIQTTWPWPLRLRKSIKALISYTLPKRDSCALIQNESEFIGDKFFFLIRQYQVIWRMLPKIIVVLKANLKYYISTQPQTNGACHLTQNTIDVLHKYVFKISSYLKEQRRECQTRTFINRRHTYYSVCSRFHNS